MRITDGLESDVGAILLISCLPHDLRVVRQYSLHFWVAWPWGERNPASRNSFPADRGFPRDPDHPDWRYTPWWASPAGDELAVGDLCTFHIPPTEVEVVRIEEPRAGNFRDAVLPWPDWVVTVLPLDDPNEDGEGGYRLDFPMPEPIEVAVIDTGAAT